MATLKTFRIIALAESATLVLLFVGSAVKAATGDELIVQLLGAPHGVLFVAYATIALSERSRFGWSRRTHRLIQLAAWLPFGGLAVERWLARRTAVSAPHS